MAHFGTLSHIAALFSAPSAFYKLLEFAEGAWQDDKGCQYITITGTDMIPEIYGRPLPEGVDIELVKVTGILTPHVHEKSESVVVVRNVHMDEAEGWFETDAGSDWETLHEGQTIVIPCGVPHGFQVDVASREPYYLVVVSYPPIENDTRYLE